MKRILFTLSILFFSLLNFFSYAHASPFGISYSQVILGKDPNNLNGWRAAVIYQPEALVWGKAQLYFDTSVGHWWVSSAQHHHSINSFSVAPYLRYWLIKKPIFSPFFEFSIAPAYISKTRLNKNNLGMHFIFQDQVGLGAAYGAKRNFYTILSLLHYSNGSLCNNNSGLTATMSLTLGYRF